MGKQRQEGEDAHQALPVRAGHGGAAAHAYGGVQLVSQYLQHSNPARTPFSPSTAKPQNTGRPISTRVLNSVVSLDSVYGGKRSFDAHLAYCGV